MPGLIGFTSLKPLSPQELDARLQKQKEITSINNNHTPYDILFGPQTAGTLICPKWQNSDQIFQNKTGVIAWLDGQLYNRAQLCHHRNISVNTDLELLVKLVTDPTQKGILKRIDGLFTAVILDAHNQKLHILTDRYGLRPLYTHQTSTVLSWASEPKAFLGLADFHPHVSTDTVTTFLTTGQLPTNQAWYNNVNAVPPATHLVFDTDTGNITRERYWWWDDVSPRVGKTNLKDLGEEMGTLFEQAVTRRVSENPIGLMLSGGLDSRAVFAALPNAPPTFTFGQPEANEVRIATEVARLKNSAHTILPMTHQNWFSKRLTGVWLTDGALNLIHMHGVEHFDKVGTRIEQCFNGAGGDGLAGAGHLFEPHELDRYLVDNLHLNFDKAPEAHAGLTAAFKNAQSSHAFYVDWRMRGFTIHGPRLGLDQGIDYILPFMDNALQEFLFALPLSIKANNKLYRTMLLQTFPEYFKHLPWAKTGKPITWPKWALRGTKVINKLRKNNTQVPLADYDAWLRQAPHKTCVETLLFGPQSCFKDFAHSDGIEELWQQHLSGQNHSDLLGRYLTLELYLRQTYNAEFRTQDEVQCLLQI